MIPCRDSMCFVAAVISPDLFPPEIIHYRPEISLSIYICLCRYHPFVVVFRFSKTFLAALSLLWLFYFMLFSLTSSYLQQILYLSFLRLSLWLFVNLSFFVQRPIPPCHILSLLSCTDCLTITVTPCRSRRLVSRFHHTGWFFTRKQTKIYWE